MLRFYLKTGEKMVRVVKINLDIALANSTLQINFMDLIYQDNWNVV